jgi:hypothetical protein
VDRSCGTVAAIGQITPESPGLNGIPDPDGMPVAGDTGWPPILTWPTFGVPFTMRGYIVRKAVGVLVPGVNATAVPAVVTVWYPWLITGESLPHYGHKLSQGKCFHYVYALQVNVVDEIYWMDGDPFTSDLGIRYKRRITSVTEI